MIEGAFGVLGPWPVGGEPVLRLAHEGAQLVEHRRGRGAGEVQGLHPVETVEHPARFLHAPDRSP